MSVHQKSVLKSPSNSGIWGKGEEWEVLIQRMKSCVWFECWNLLRKAALPSSLPRYSPKLGCQESLTGSLQDFGVDDPSPRFPEIWISICLRLLRHRAEGLIWMRQRAINPGSCLPQGLEMAVRERASEQGEQAVGFLGSCDTLLRSFLSHKQ